MTEMLSIRYFKNSYDRYDKFHMFQNDFTRKQQIHVYGFRNQTV